jgi:hypothetical protein
MPLDPPTNAKGIDLRHQPPTDLAAHKQGVKMLLAEYRTMASTPLGGTPSARMRVIEEENAYEPPPPTAQNYYLNALEAYPRQDEQSIQELPHLHRNPLQASFHAAQTRQRQLSTPLVVTADNAAILGVEPPPTGDTTPIID